MADGRPEFHIGLVMAGAISAGAYTAGVIDFLLQALEEWHKAKRDQNNTPLLAVPDHSVRLRVISGSSAGAMTAAIVARALVTGVTPVTDADHPPDVPDDDPTRQRDEFCNPLFAAWVQSIDIRHLLGQKDLEPRGAKVVSLLDSSILPFIGDNALRTANSGHRDKPDYVGETVDLLLTTTNLRGVPYGFGLIGQQAGYRHMMTCYADHVRFALRWASSAHSSGAAPNGIEPQAIPLESRNLGATGNWSMMMTTALASGAFPIGLAPQLLSRKAIDYDRRKWEVPDGHPLKTVPINEGEEPKNVPPELAAQRAVLNAGADSRALQAVSMASREILPTWPDGIRDVQSLGNGANPSYDYHYWNVDGGVMDNEPLELARQILSSGGRNPRDGRIADRAMLMIDPFPNTSDVHRDYDRNINIVQIALKLFGALKEQARFKPDELKLAEDENVYSRFVISPIYIDANDKLTTPAMASAIMGGFGGFLAESFRRHDFQLGRRNCQRFLARHFALPFENPIFNTWRHNTDLVSTFTFEDLDDSGTAQKFAPIIPLVGELKTEIPLPRRPRAAEVDLVDLRRRIRDRLDAVMPRLIDDVPAIGLRLLLRALWIAAKLVGQRGKIVDLIMGKIESELVSLG